MIKSAKLRAAQSIKAEPGKPPKQAVAMSAPKSKRPSGQFAVTRESTGKMNGGGHGEPMHPQSHADFEKLGGE